MSLLPQPQAPEVKSGPKTVKITLAWYVRQYKVLAITNTTALKPGMWLEPSYVDKLCGLTGWEVDIYDNDLVQIGTQVLGEAAGKVALGGM